MEKSTDEPNKENRSSAPGVLQAEADGPAPAAGGAGEMSRAGSVTQNSKLQKRVGFTEECTGEMSRTGSVTQNSKLQKREGFTEECTGEMSRTGSVTQNSKLQKRVGFTEECTGEMSRAGSVTQNSKLQKRVRFTEECTGEMERPSGTERDSPAAFETAVLERDSPNSMPFAGLTNTNSPEMSTLELNHQCSDTATLDMDCMICFNKYSIYRVPKLLDCQHAFCAVCLKLILRKEENIWIITCPLCRKPTFVSGGLIRTLQDKEDILERLENLDSSPEVYVCALGLDGNSWTQSSQEILNTEENSSAHSSLAVQRLILLLLLGVILAMLILPFMYSGRVKWVICLLLSLGLLMSVVLCCTPKFHCRCKKDSATSCEKEIHVVTVA